MGKNEKGRVDLTNILYNEDGTFKPLTDYHGNVSFDLANLRNKYMEAEREYFEHLLSFENIYQRFLKAVDMNSDDLFAYAMRIKDKLETGTLETPDEMAEMAKMSPEQREKYHMMMLEIAEGEMCLYLAAAKDKIKIQELVKIMDEEILPRTRGRY